MKKNKNILLTLVIITLVVVGFYFILNKHKQVLSPTSANNKIQLNGFSIDESELIIDVVVKAGVKKEEILQVNKMEDGKAGVVTGDPNSYGTKRGGNVGYNAGKLFYLINTSQGWQIESTSAWIE